MKKQIKRPQGLFRTLLAGEGASLTEAFSQLTDSADTYNRTLITERNITSACLDVPANEGSGHWELININNEIYAVISKCNFNDVRREVVPPEDFIELHICFTGPVQLDLSGEEEVSSTSPFLFVCKQGAAAEYEVRFEPGQRHMLAVYVKPSVIRAFGLAPETIPLSLHKLLNGPEDRITYLQLPISIAVLDITKQVLYNRYPGHSHLIFTEAKVWELLCIFIDELTKNDVQGVGNISEITSGQDMEMFEQARRILEENLESTPTIVELAKLVGTNTTKLKQGFKLIFGETIFECSHHYKMKEALKLLAEQKLTVGRVANAVGYHHQASFAAAFKDYYGILPKDAKKLSGVKNLAPADPVS